MHTDFPFKKLEQCSMLVEITAQEDCSTAVGQFIRRDTTISTPFLANKLSEKGVEEHWRKGNQPV